MAAQTKPRRISAKSRQADSLEQYEGKWVALLRGKVVASGDTLREIAPFVTRSKDDRRPPGERPYAFKP